MRYRIHYTLADGSEDSIVLSGDTIEEIREKANVLEIVERYESRELHSTVTLPEVRHG